MTDVRHSNDTYPLDYHLYANFPNPFNPSTTIAFSLPVDDHVSVIVYNIKGDEVATLLDQDLNAGLHEVNWSARQELASGVYISRLRTRAFTQSKRMVLLK